MIKGGNLCEKINENEGEDKYTLGENYFAGVYEDEHDKNILIKIIQDKGEYKLSKLLEVNGFTPKIYGYFDCNNTVKVPQYSFEQQKIKAYNFSHPKDKKDLGEIKYKTYPKNVKYMVMEKIKGKSLVSSGEDTIKKHMNEIYRLYNILADKGYILGDLAARNIILSDDDKIYFIDFDPIYTINTLKSIPISKRMSKEKLQKILVDEANENYYKGGKINQKNKSRKYRKNKNNKTKKGGSSTIQKGISSEIRYKTRGPDRDFLNSVVHSSEPECNTKNVHKRLCDSDNKWSDEVDEYIETILEKLSINNVEKNKYKNLLNYDRKHKYNKYQKSPEKPEYRHEESQQSSTYYYPQMLYPIQSIPQNHMYYYPQNNTQNSQSFNNNNNYQLTNDYYDSHRHPSPPKNNNYQLTNDYYDRHRYPSPPKNNNNEYYNKNKRRRE